VTRRVDPGPLRGLDVKVVQIDSELSGLLELAAGHDVLVDAAGPYPLAPCLPGGAQWQAHVDAAVKRMEHVIDVVRRRGVRLAYVSSSTTLSRNECGLQAAATVWRRTISPYFEAKAAMEHAVVAAAREGLPAVIVNPASFLGPWEFRPTGNFVRMVLERRFSVVLNQDTCVIDVRDVADAIDRALSQELYGHPIPLSGHNIGWRDLVMRTAELAGLAIMPPIPLDPSFVSASAYWMQMGWMAMGFAPPTALSFVPLIADALPFPRSAAQIALGVEIRPLDQTLCDTLAFLQSSAAHNTSGHPMIVR
jgi:dihydroflavonol-4-reductase